MMPISMLTIPANLREPKVVSEYSSENATSGPGNQPFKGLIIGQRLSGGSVDALTPKRMTSAAQAKNYFGEGSVLHRQAIAWFQDNKITEVFGVAFDDPSGSAKAGGSILFTGPATASGTLSLYIAGDRIQIGVTSGDTADDIAAAVNTALDNASDLPLSSAIDGAENAQINFTALNAGTLGDDLDIRFNYFDSEELPAGVGVTITAMTGGSGVPDFDDLWAILGDEHYNVWAMPWTDSASMNAVTTELADRAGPLRAIEAMAFASKDDTHANLGTFGNGQNSEFVSVIHPSGKGSPTPSFEVGANYAAINAYYMSIDPARGCQTLSMTHVKAPAEKDRFTYEENNLLLFDGISTAKVDSSGVVRISRAITLYQENSAGADDTAYLDVTSMFILSYLRWSVTTRLELLYPRHKLANDGTRYGQGQAIVTPKVIKGELVSIFQEWEFIGLVEDADQFKNDIIVERNISDPNRVDVLLPPNLVNMLIITALKIEFRV